MNCLKVPNSPAIPTKGIHCFQRCCSAATVDLSWLSYTSVWTESHNFFWGVPSYSSIKSSLPGLLEPKRPVTFWVCGFTFWGFFPWALATLFQFPLFGLSGVLVVSRLMGGTLKVFSVLVTSWASKGECFGRPTIEDSSSISFSNSQVLWGSHACLSRKGLRLKGRTLSLFPDFPLIALLMCHLSQIQIQILGVRKAW